MSQSHETISGRILRQVNPAVFIAALLLLGGAGLVVSRSAAEGAHVIPPPAADASASQATSETAVFAGGCFWGVQGVFQHVEGVTDAVSGYAGGDMGSAHYNKVSAGLTKHAEAVRITYDPRKITYGRLLHIFFSVAHNPTELNRQGPDVGPHYRSAIFPENAEQVRVAKAYIAQLDEARVFKKPIVTRIEPEKIFFPAEAYHQNYMIRNPRNRYIVVNDLPKVEDLKRIFPGVYRAEPVLVATAAKSN